MVSDESCSRRGINKLTTAKQKIQLQIDQSERLRLKIRLFPESFDSLPLRHCCSVARGPWQTPDASS